MPKGETRGALEQLARRCHDRAGRAAHLCIRRALAEEEADWLAFAQDDHARRIDRFRAAVRPAPQPSCMEGPRLQHMDGGRPASPASKGTPDLLRQVRPTPRPPPACVLYRALSAAHASAGRGLSETRQCRS
jgi:hypothetical protein